jgi:hypothetical protein
MTTQRSPLLFQANVTYLSQNNAFWSGPMNRIACFSATLALACCLWSASDAVALRIAIPNRSAAQQAIQADVIVVGKVTEVEKEMARATPFPGSKDQVEFHVGVVKISQKILGAKGLTTVRVGWQQVAPIPIGGPIRRPPIRQPIALTEGLEGCFLLNKHHDGDFYVLAQWGQPVDKKAADFNTQLETVKKVVKIFDDPTSALKAKDVAERQFAAAVLLQKYRMYPQYVVGEPKQQEISAELSKLIMQTIGEGDWTKFEQKDGIPLGPQNLFGMLAIQPGKDGFNPPMFKPGQQDFAKVYADYVTKWIKDNAENYRIKRYVAGK